MNNENIDLPDLPPISDLTYQVAFPDSQDNGYRNEHERQIEQLIIIILFIQYKKYYII